MEPGNLEVRLVGPRLLRETSSPPVAGYPYFFFHPHIDTPPLVRRVIFTVGIGTPQSPSVDERAVSITRSPSVDIKAYVAENRLNRCM